MPRAGVSTACAFAAVADVLGSAILRAAASVASPAMHMESLNGPGTPVRRGSGSGCYSCGPALWCHFLRCRALRVQQLFCFIMIQCHHSPVLSLSLSLSRMCSVVLSPVALMCRIPAAARDALAVISAPAIYALKEWRKRTARSKAQRKLLREAVVLKPIVESIIDRAWDMQEDYFGAQGSRAALRDFFESNRQLMTKWNATIQRVQEFVWHARKVLGARGDRLLPRPDEAAGASRDSCLLWDDARELDSLLNRVLWRLFANVGYPLQLTALEKSLPAEMSQEEIWEANMQLQRGYAFLEAVHLHQRASRKAFGKRWPS